MARQFALDFSLKGKLKSISGSEAGKCPDNNGKWWQVQGDNIYDNAGGKWLVRRNRYHSTKENMEYDRTGINVLICKRFWCFGDHPEELQPRFHELIKKGPGHKRFEETPLIKQFIAWLHKKPTGIRSTDHLREDQPEKCTPKHS